MSYVLPPRYHDKERPKQLLNVTPKCTVKDKENIIHETCKFYLKSVY